MTLTGKSRVAGIFGWPISHTQSPRLHGYWLQHYGIDGIYIAFPVHPDTLRQAVAALPVLGIRGVNVTIPHKEQVVTLCDVVDPLALRIGAVNTLVVQPDGSIHGSNSDAFGFLEGLREGCRKAGSVWSATAGPAVVLGAGGAARAVVGGLLDCGAPLIRVVNRSVERAQALADSFDGPVEAVAWDRHRGALADAALVVNSTSLGMTGQPPLEIDLATLPVSAIVNDLVYAPLETPLLAAARQRGNLAVDGLAMLLHQGRPGFREWFGRDPDVTEEQRKFVLEALT